MARLILLLTQGLKISKMSVCQSSSLALSILLACCAVIHCVGAQSTVSTVYIIPAPDSPPMATCPGEPCLTIDQYVSNSSLRNGITDITMQLQPGYHNLSIPFTIDTTTSTDSSISSIAMTGTVPGDVTLLCTEEFSFNFMDSVRISGINLINCGGPSTHIRNVDNFTLEDSTFQSDTPFRVRLSANPVIVNSVFTNCTSGALSIRDSRPMIRNCTFSNNVKQRMRSLPGDIDGGVIYLDFVNAFIDQCTFENNSANFTSGAIYINDGGLYVTNSYFLNNAAFRSEGGAIYSIGASISIEDSNFTNNSGQNGGAVNILGEDNTIVIRRCDFVNNTAVFEGGAVQIQHRNNDLSRRLYTRIDNSRFVGNSASRGGAVLKRGSNIFFSTFQSSYVNNSCSSDFDASGALFFIVSKAEIVVTQTIFTKNQGYYGAVAVVDGRNYSVTVQNCDFMENVATNSGGAIALTSSGVGNITIRDSEFNRNSAPQCGALDLHVSDMNPNIRTRNGLNVKVLASNFANNTATVRRGGALCASDISVSVSGSGFTPVSTFRQNSAITGGGAISTSNSVLTISGASFSDNNARSGGDAIHACSSEVNIESSDGLLSMSMDGQCLLYNNNMTFPSSGVSSHAINWALLSFMTSFMFVNIVYYNY